MSSESQENNQDQSSQSQRSFKQHTSSSSSSPDSSLHLPKRARTSEPYIPDTNTSDFRRGGSSWDLRLQDSVTSSSNVTEPYSAPPSSTNFDQPYLNIFRPPHGNAARPPYWERPNIQKNPTAGYVPYQQSAQPQLRYTGNMRPTASLLDTSVNVNVDPRYISPIRSTSSRPPTPITPLPQGNYAVPYSVPMGSSISSSSSSSSSATYQSMHPQVPSQSQHYIHQPIPTHTGPHPMYTPITTHQPETSSSSSSSTMSFVPIESQRHFQSSISNSPSPPLRENSPSQPPGTPISADPNSDMKVKSKGKHKGIPGPKARIPIEAKVTIAEHIISKGVAMANFDELAQMTGLTKQQIKSQLVDNRQNVRKQLNEFARSLQ